MATLAEIINDINQIDLSGRSGVDTNWPRTVKAMQGLLAVYQGMERAGTLPTDHIASVMLGDGTTRKLRRLVYIPGTTTVKIQKNTGSDATPVWADLISIDISGNLTLTGALTGTLPAHISTHLPGGSDPIPTAAPTDIGAANAAGSGTNLVLANHVHKGIHSIDKDGSGAFYGDVNFVSSARIPLSAGANSITVGFTSPNRTYISTKGAADQTITNSTTELGLTNLTNLTIPGANSSRNYKLDVIAHFTTTGVTATQIHMFVRQGTAGTLADAAIYQATNYNDTTTFATGKAGQLICAGYRIVAPASGQKISIGVQTGTAVATVVTFPHLNNVFCTLRMEEEL